VSDLYFYLAIVATLFAIVDPIGTLPFYVSLTQGFGASDRDVIVHRSCIVLGSVLAVFALVGRFLFMLFGFTLYAFEIAGGILLFYVAFDMLRGEITKLRLSDEDREDAISRRDEISVVPLGIPLLAGPGAISTVMIFEGSAPDTLLALIATFVAIGVTTIATFFILRYGPRILNSVGRVGIMAMTRVLGLVLAAVGVQFVISGILGAFSIA
jgi:multiple antibiotic resistance protein